MTLPNTGAPELAQSQALPETTINEATRLLDANVFGAILEDRDLATPPGACADGARYLVAASPTGLWSGKAGMMAIAVGTDASNGWLFQTIAVEGYEIYVRDENAKFRHDGSTWTAISSGAPATEASDAEGWAGDENGKFISPRRMFTLAAEVALADGATITPDFDTGINFAVTLGGNRTLANPTNAKSGQSGVIFVTQDGTGSRSLTYGTNWKFPGGTPTLSTAAGAVDLISYFVRANGTIAATLSKALA